MADRRGKQDESLDSVTVTPIWIISFLQCHFGVTVIWCTYLKTACKWAMADHGGKMVKFCIR